MPNTSESGSAAFDAGAATATTTGVEVVPWSKSPKSPNSSESLLLPSCTTFLLFSSAFDSIASAAAFPLVMPPPNKSPKGSELLVYFYTAKAVYGTIDASKSIGWKALAPEAPSWIFWSWVLVGSDVREEIGAAVSKSAQPPSPSSLPCFSS